MVSGGWELRKANGGRTGKAVLQLVDVKSWDIMYSVVITDNNNILYLHYKYQSF